MKLHLPIKSDDKQMKKETPESPRTDVNTLGEFGLIDHLTQRFPLLNTSSALGIGDDAAVIDNKNFQTVVSTDMLVEGIHFDLMYTPLKHLGYKSVIVNLSDIYAMNAYPKQITVSLALSNRFSVEALEEFYDGVYAACEQYGVDLVGGDTTSTNKGLIISVTAIGQGEKEKLVYRSGAKVGDLLCLTGNLGGAYLGLQILERELVKIGIWKSEEKHPDGIFDNEFHHIFLVQLRVGISELTIQQDEVSDLCLFDISILKDTNKYGDFLVPHSLEYYQFISGTILDILNKK